MSCTVAELDVLSMRLVMPGRGNWVTDLEADGEALSGKVTIDDGEGNLFAGFVLRSGEVVGRISARLIGGTGGLKPGSQLTPRHFRGSTVRAVLAEIARQTGESIDNASDSATLARSLAYWSIGAEAPGAALNGLCDALGVTWRVLGSGGIWVGPIAYPASDIEHEELAQDHASGIVEIASEGFALRPGVTLASRKVTRVEHRIDASGRRTAYWYD